MKIYTRKSIRRQSLNILKIRIILWLILAIIIGWFSYFKVVPTGRISYEIAADQPNYFIGKLTPEDRVAVGQTGVTVKGDPVYFSVRPPRRFTRAKVTVKFKNTTDLPVVELGLLNGKVAWNYELKPLQNKIIDQLSLVWPTVSSETGARLIEREKKYNTVEQFLNNLPPKSEIALYNYILKTEFKLADYKPQPESRAINYNWRGAYQFYTYIKNEALAYVFDFADLNLNQDSDPVEIKVYSQDGLIYEKRIADDAASERQVSLKITDLPEGAYRISFIANDDIITKKITSPQSQFALINKVWLAQGNAKNLVLHTNSRAVSAQTINPASLSQVKVGGGAINLNETHKQFSALTNNQPETIELAKDDIIISGDGVFALAADSLLDPRLPNVDRNLEISQGKINYILTGYQGAKSADGWQTAAADFDLTKAYQENGKYQFLLSLPGRQAGELTGGEVVIKEIKVELTGTSLPEKIKKYFKRPYGN